MLEDMLALVRGNHLCVLATVHQGEPHTSLMAYLSGEGGCRVYLISSSQTQKYRNVLAEPWVSLLIDDRQEATQEGAIKALSLRGACAPAPPEEQEGLKARFARELPHLAGIVADPAAVVLAVKVRAMQLLAGPTESSYVELD